MTHEEYRTLGRRLLFIQLAVGCMMALFFIVACTVTPRVVRSPGATFDGTNLNSGLIGYAADGSCVLTPHAKERYDALVSRYGTNFVGLKVGDGLTLIRGTNAFGGGDGDWLLDPEHCAKFGIMNAWRMSGR